MADTANRIEAKLRRPDTVGDEGWGVALDEDEAAALADAVEAARNLWFAEPRSPDTTRFDPHHAVEELEALSEALARLDDAQ